MNTTELIEIAKECCFSRQVVGDETALITFRSEQLQQFAQRIEQPLLELVDQLNKKIDWQIEAISAQQAQIAEYAARLEMTGSKMKSQQRQIAELEKDCEILQTNLDAALMQIKQLRDELRNSYTLHYQVLHDLITRAQQTAYSQKLEDDEFHEAVIGLSDSLVKRLEKHAAKALEETK